MRFNKILKSFISLVCVVTMLFSTCAFPVAASDAKSVTASTSTSIKQGNSGTCYVYIDSTESLAALDVTVHFDSTKVKISSVYNSVSCTLYDSVTNTDNIQFKYLFDGKGSASKTRLFYFYYQVLSNAEAGLSYFDITIGESYDSSLNDVAVSGSRTSFEITQTVTTKSCSISSSSTINTSVEKEFSLAYRFSTYQIASGSAVITYDPELFEVVNVTNGGLLNNKLADINKDLSGAVYISFIGTEYATKYDFVTVRFKTIKNVTKSSEITFKATELCDKDLNASSCSDYNTTANVVFDEAYVGDAPKMSISAEYNAANKKVTAFIFLAENSHLGAGDFVLEFNPTILTVSSYKKGFNPDFFNVNDKELANGRFKFSIISIEDIVDSQTVLTIVFDANITCVKQQAEMLINGSMLSDSLTKPIKLNFIDDIVELPLEHQYGEWIIDKEATTTEEGSMHRECSACGNTTIESIAKLESVSEIIRKGKTLEYKDMIFVKLVFDLVNIDLTQVDISKDAGMLYWSQEEFSTLDKIAFDPNRALVGLAPYIGTDFYFGKSDGFYTRYLAEEYYYVGYVKLPDGTYIFSEPLLYGPKTYAYNMLGKESTKEETKQLCIALLNYITAAQKYFYPNIAEEKLADIGLTAEQKELKWNEMSNDFNLAEAIPTEKMVEQDTTVFQRNGKNLRFQEMISLISVYQIRDSIIENASECGTIFWTAEQFAALVGMPSIDNIGEGKRVPIENYGQTNTWVSVAPAVAAKDMADTSYYILGYIRHSDGKISYSGVMSYSFEQYMYNKAIDESASLEMSNFAKRLYIYERAARDALK